MRRRDFLKTASLGAAAWAAAGPALAQGAAAGGRPNILLYVSDDQGMGDAGCYGSRHIHTPGLDQLAETGTRFTHAFCTTPSCSPSRSVILTGQYNHANGQYGLEHNYHHFASFDTVRALPVMLEAAGYRTRRQGKYHVAPEAAYHFQEAGTNAAPADMARQCRDFVSADGPFFLYFCTHEPHRPFHGDGSEPVDPADVAVPPFLPDTPECRGELARYAMSVQRADSGLLELIKVLRETGKWENTLIVYVSDNGIPFPGAKTNLYDPGTRLPCVVRAPGQTSGRVSDAMIMWADLTPTILDYAGALPEKSGIQGTTFRPALESDQIAGWDEVYLSHTFHEVTMYYPMRAVRTRRHKLIWNIAHGLPFPFASDLYGSETWQGVLERGDTMYGRRSVAALLNRPRFELYDLESDPDEVVNLAEDSEHVVQLEELCGKLRAFQERTKDPWILKWDRE